MKTLPLLFVVQKWFHLFSERFPSDLNIPQPFFPSYNIASVELLLFYETSVLSTQYNISLHVAYFPFDFT